jgi:hypothetical protein
MIAAFFHDERFGRDDAGAWFSTSGGVPHRALARYLGHFERLIVVGRLADGARPGTGTLASGEGIAWACVEAPGRWTGRAVVAAARRVREVLARVDGAIVRLPSLMGALACREALRAGIPFLVEMVGDPFDALWNHGTLAGRLAALPMALVTRHYVRRAPFANYVTGWTLQRRYPSRGVAAAVSDVIIDPPGPEVLARRLSALALRRRGAPAVLGLIGSYDVRYKGHETALRAVARLHAAGRAVTLRCIGVGDPARWRARATALGIAAAVELGPPRRHGAAVLEWLDGLDLYVVPSLQEGLPRALVEAMSRGLPAVGSRRGGIPELVDARWLHRPGDSRALARLVAALLDDPAELAAQARRSWATAARFVARDLDARRDALVRRFVEAAAARAGARAGARSGAFAP